MVVLLVVAKFLIILGILAICDAMTMKQIRSTGKMIRKTCLPKFEVEEELVDKLGQGIFTEDHELMCYMGCVMKMANAMKNGKVNIEAALKQADLLLPEEIKEPAKAAITACRKVPDKYKDPCEGAYHITACIYKENPDIFYFP